MRTIDLELAKKLLHYCPETGRFTWKHGHRAGLIAGGVEANGYVAISFGNQKILAHRLAWAFEHGEFPHGFLDHINQDKTDNRIENLRPATHTQNVRNRQIQKNSSTGLKGVNFHKRAQKFRAQIKVNGQKIHLGTFATATEAHAAYCRAAQELHGEFACYG